MHLLGNNFKINGYKLLKRSPSISPAGLVNRYCLISVIIYILLKINTICAQSQLFKAHLVKAICQIGKTSDGLELANCSGTYYFTRYNHTKKVVIPDDLPSTIEVIDVSNKGGSEPSDIFFLSETEAAMYQNYPNLKRIIQRNSVQFPDYDVPANEYWDRRGFWALLHGFSELPMLEYFEFSRSNLSNYYPIFFPKSLKTLNLSSNYLSYLNVKMCPELEEVNVNWNARLDLVPIFHVPLPPIKTLRMKGCPLKKMTILDIAPLCELTLLELQFPMYSHYETEEGYCQCVLLKQWIAHAKLKGGENIKCIELHEEDKPECSSNTFKKAEELRKRCPLLKQGDAVLTRLINILKYIFFSILLLLLLATLILYVIRHFHLREYWRNYHANLEKATAFRFEEEEEESLKNQSSPSISSVSFFEW